MQDNLEINPWITIWFQPRKTIQAIVEYRPFHRFFVLAMIYGLTSLLSFAQSFSVGLTLNLPILLLLILISSPLWGYVIISLTSWIVYHTGRWIGGNAPYSHVRAAFAWSNVPMIANLFLWVLLLILFRGDLFRGFPGSYIFEGYQYSALFGILLLQVVFGIWSLVLYLNTLAQVQQFSVGKAIVNVIIAGVIFLAAFILITIAVAWIAQVFFQPIMVG